MDDTKMREEWDTYRKTRRGYLHDKDSFEAGYSAGMASAEERVKQLRELVRNILDSGAFYYHTDSPDCQICLMRAEAERLLSDVETEGGGDELQLASAEQRAQRAIGELEPYGTRFDYVIRILRGDGGRGCGHFPRALRDEEKSS